ncbi:DNA primase [Aerococcaceae bacterium zg-B36]|uniref:phage/plasmid primase, P4 family n=1 Tax=Aerococcaceae bacterium zg-252 TaxID=2796928 RepID=UPI001BD881C5|nr:DNA primase [Aerococcaceae bacterium zg-B36]
MYDNIPTELVELDQWCVYRKEWVPQNRKYTKIPYNPKTGYMAKSNDPTTWVDFDTAVELSEHFDGIGFFFHDGYYGVDLDNIESEVMRYLDNDWQDNIVADFIETLTSYAEISPSGTGVHIICKGSLPPGGRRKGDIEMYDHGRFFTVTGNRIGSYIGVFDDSGINKINYLHHKYIGETNVNIEDLSAIRTDGNDLTIDEIIEHAQESKNGMRFKFFMEGGWEQFFPSQSEADMSFANDLAFWCARDYDKMDSIYRRSSLMRDKWDSKRENSTYGHITLLKAIQECLDVYQPFTLNISDEALKGSGKPKIRQTSFSYDDMGNAQRFMSAFGENVLYSYINKVWYYYANKYWAVDELGKVYSMADYIANNIHKEPVSVSDPTNEKLVEEAVKALSKHVKATRSVKGKRNMLEDVKHHVSVAPNEFDANGLLFNTQNGYIDLANGHLMEHSKEKKFTRISFAEYREDAECPRWLAFLDEIFEGNKELIDYMQRAIGYSLSAETSEQVMFILLGNGRNGKSVLLNVLNDVFGTYAMNIQPHTIAIKGNVSGGANPDIARLQGARFVTTTEPNRGMKFDEGVIKQITGDDKLTARFLYGTDFEFKPEFKLWMATNYKPIITGTDEGIWRRMVIIPFNYYVTPDKVDKRLTYKLKEEITGILKWCVEGYQLWRENGLNEPKIIAEQRHEYRNEMDMVAQFVEETCIVNPLASVKASELWQFFRDWVKENNEYDKMSSKRFYLELGKTFGKEKRMDGNYYKGLKINQGERDKYLKNHLFDGVDDVG